MTASKERILKICEYCGKSFYALKSTTRYCSKQCNSYAYKAARREEKVKMAETMSHRKASEKSMSEILVKEYLTIQEVAILLGLSRQTIYSHYSKGKTTSFNLLLLPTPNGMGRRRIHAAFILYKTLGYPELGYSLLYCVSIFGRNDCSNESKAELA